MKVVGFCGFSGSGKTTLVEQLISRLRLAGQRVSVIKHAHHDFDIDQPGKDSHRHRHAGCREVLVTSANRWAVMHELRGRSELTLDEALSQLSPCDLVLVEGFKHADVPKLEVWRAATGKPALYPNDPFVVAVVTDHGDRLPHPTGLPLLDLNDPDAVIMLFYVCVIFTFT